MALFGKDVDAIVDEALSALRANTPITRFTPGAKARALVKVMGSMTSGLYDVFDFHQIIPFVSGASGIYLDYIGELTGVPRLPPRQASISSTEGNVMFYTLSSDFGAINNGESIVIPANTIVSSPAGKGRTVRYRTVGRHVLPANQDQTFVTVEAVVDGTSSNVGSDVLTVHDFVDYAKAAEGSLLVTNLSPIDTGGSREEDDLYRFRIMNSAFRAETANQTAIRLAILAVPSVADMRFLEYLRGIGTSDVIVSSVTGRVGAEMVAQAQAAVDRVRAHSAHILVRGPEEIGMSFSMTLAYRPGTTDAMRTLVEREVGRNLRKYVRELEIAEPFIVNEAVQRVMESDDRIQDMGVPGSPFDEIYTYRDGVSPTNRTRRRLIGNFRPELDEKMVVEDSLPSPVTIRRT